MHVLANKVWEGSCQNNGTWPNITFANTEGTIITVKYTTDVKPGTLVWEGVTNAKKCYFDPGMARFAEATNLFARANAGGTPDEALLEQAMSNYQKTIDLLSSIKPHAEGFFKNEFIHSEAQKRITVAEVMVPKINAALNFNTGIKAFEKALSIEQNSEAQGAISDLKTSQRHLDIAVKDYVELALKLDKDPPQVAEMNQKADSCRRVIKESEILIKYLEKSIPLFSIPSLKDERKTFELESLVDAIGRNTREWRQVRGAVGDSLEGGKLESLSKEQEARRVEADNIISFRSELANALQKSAKEEGSIRPAMDREKFDDARTTIAGIKRRLNSLEVEELGNQDEAQQIQAVMDQMSCFEKEINFQERSLTARRSAELGLRNAENHKDLSSSFAEFRNLSDEAGNVEDLCADEAWVDWTRTNATEFVNRISAHMRNSEWIEKDNDWLAPTIENFQAELDERTSITPLEGAAFDEAVYYHGKVLEILQRDPAKVKTLTLTNKTGNASYLIEHAKQLRAAKDYDGAMAKTALVSSFYSDTELKWPAFQEGKLNWLIKNMALVIGIAVGVFLLFLILFLRRFSAKVIERKQRNTLDALSEKRKMDPAKKVSKIDGVIRKLEKLESKRKLSKNGKAYAKMAYVDKAASLLRMGKKDAADSAIKRAGEFQRVEPEDILPSQAVYHVKSNDTSDAAMEVYADYLNLPDSLINEKLEIQIRELVANGVDEAPVVEEANTFEPPPPAEDRFMTSEIDIGDAAHTPPPPPPPSAPKTISKASVKKKTKSVIIKRKK